MRKEAFLLRHEFALGDPQSGDAQDGDWSRERLIGMDTAFRQRFAWALRRGLESEQAQPTSRTGGISDACGYQVSLSALDAKIAPRASHIARHEHPKGAVA